MHLLVLVAGAALAALAALALTAFALAIVDDRLADEEGNRPIVDRT
jgi:hypothetical protein